MKQLLSAGSIEASTLSDSVIFNEKDDITTDIPIINIAFSGKIDGGLTTGLTVLAGESKSFKTLLSLHCMKAYFDKYEDSIALFYDSEFGSTPEYLNQFGLDTSRIAHIPINTVEQLKFDIRKRLESIQRGQRVFIMIDSLGNLASSKEDEDALNAKSVADMSRAKAIKSLFRIITPHLTIKDIPCIVVNHIYKEMGMYPKNIVSGGTGVMYSANQVFIITRAQEKDGDKELIGYNFTLNVEKSRYVKEKSKMTFTILHGKGIQKYSGLWDLAVESNIIKEVSKGWYTLNGTDKRRSSDIENDLAFWDDLVKNKKFNKFVEDKFILKSELEFENATE